MNEKGAGEEVIYELQGTHPSISRSPLESSVGHKEVGGSQSVADNPAFNMLRHALNGLTFGISAPCCQRNEAPTSRFARKRW